MDGVEVFTDGVEVLPSKLGGLGLFARRAFAKGDALLVERPFMTVGSLSRHQQWNPAQAAPRAIEEQVALLPDAQREEFWKFGAAPIYGQTPSASSGSTRCPSQSPTADLERHLVCSAAPVA